MTKEKKRSREEEYFIGEGDNIENEEDKEINSSILETDEKKLEDEEISDLKNISILPKNQSVSSFIGFEKMSLEKNPNPNSSSSSVTNRELIKPKPNPNFSFVSQQDESGKVIKKSKSLRKGLDEIIK